MCVLVCACVFMGAHVGVSWEQPSKQRVPDKHESKNSENTWRLE